MRLVAKSPAETLAHVRSLSENAINAPSRKNRFARPLPPVVAPATGRELPPLPVPRREHSGTRNFLRDL